MHPPRYEIRSLIAKGATGGVYKAIDTHTQRKVALRRFFLEEDEPAGDQWHPEFIRFCKQLARIQHPNIMSVLDAGIDAEGPFIVSTLDENFQAKKMQQWIRGRRLSEREALHLTQQLLSALAHAHKHGVFHGSLSFASLWIEDTPSGPKLLIRDLGMSQIAAVMYGVEIDTTRIFDYRSLAPERFKNQPVDARTDCYGIGQLIYSALSHGPNSPFRRIRRSLELHHAGNLPNIKSFRPSISGKFTKWLHSMTATNPEDRPPSIEAAIESLTTTLASREKPSFLKHPYKILAGTLGSAAAIIIAFTFTEEVVPAADPEDPISTLPPSTSQVPIKILDHSLIYSVDATHGHPQTHTQLNPEKLLDWRVFSTPAARPSVYGSDPWIGKLTRYGDAKQEDHEVGNLNFYNHKSETRIQPDLRLSSDYTYLGWSLPITLASSPNTTRITLHFSSWDSDVELSILTAGTSEPLFKESFHSPNGTQSYAISIDLRAPRSGPPQQLKLRLTTPNDVSQEKWHALSLNAITIEALNPQY